MPRNYRGIRRRPDNSLPLDRDPRVTFYLLPLPIGHAKRQQPERDSAASIAQKLQKGGKGKKGKGRDNMIPPKNLPEELRRRLEKGFAGITTFLRAVKVVSGMAKLVHRCIL